MMSVVSLALPAHDTAAQDGPFFYCASGVQAVRPGSVLYCNFLGSEMAMAATLIESSTTASVYMGGFTGVTCQVDAFRNRSWQGTLKVDHRQTGKALCFRTVNAPTGRCLTKAIDSAEIYCYPSAGS